jgi:hypothetical protein
LLPPAAKGSAQTPLRPKFCSAEAMFGLVEPILWGHYFTIPGSLKLLFSRLNPFKWEGGAGPGDPNCFLLHISFILNLITEYQQPRYIEPAIIYTGCFIKTVLKYGLVTA